MDPNRFSTSDAIAAAVRRSLGTPAAAVTQPTQAPSAPPSELMRIVVPSARDRWMNGRLRNYTPEQIESILVGAFAGDLTQRWQLFDLMESNYRIAKNLNELKAALTDHDWPLQPASAPGMKPTTEAIRRQQIIEDIIWHTEPDPTRDESDFEDMLRDFADAWSKGISVQELDYVQRKGPLGTIIGLKAARWVHPRNYGYPSTLRGEDRLMLNLAELGVDNPKLTEAINQLVSAGKVEQMDQWATFPPDKFLVGVRKIKTGHAIGGALLAPLAWWWCVENFASEWLVRLAQIFGIPQRFAYYAQGTAPEQIRKIEEMLDQMGAEAWGAFPQGTLIEIKEGVRALQDNPSLAVKHAAEMAYDLLILGQTLTSTQGDRGSQALGRVHADVLSQNKRAILGWVGKNLNQQFIPMLCRLNFGNTDEMPFFLLGDEAEEDAKKTAETLSIVLKSGIAVPARYAYEKLGIPEPQNGEAVIEGTSGGTTGPLVVDPDEDEPAANAGRAFAMAGRAVDVALADVVAEQLTGIEARFVRGARAPLLQILELAKDNTVSEAQLRDTVEALRLNLPEFVGERLDTESLALAMEKAMGAAMVNGALSAK